MDPSNRSDDVKSSVNESDKTSTNESKSTENEAKFTANETSTETSKSKFAGLSKLFNNNTTTGRANVAKATVGSLFLAFLVYKFVMMKKKDTKTPVTITTTQKQSKNTSPASTILTPDPTNPYPAKKK